MPTTPYIQIVPSGAAKMYFDLIGQDSHKVDDSPLGPQGDITVAMDDWSEGMLGIEEGLIYRQGMRKYVHSTGADASFPGQVIMQSVGSTIAVGSGPALAKTIKQLDFVPSGGTMNTYLIEEGSSVHRLVNPGTTNTWTEVTTLANSGIDGVVHGGRIAAACTSTFKHSSDGTTWTNASTNATAFGVLNQNVERAVFPNTLYSGTALNGTWDSGSTIGDVGSSINSLLALEQVLMVGKSNGIYSIDAEGVVTQFTPELRTQANANFASPGAVAVFNGDYYFRTLNGVIEISGADGQKRRVGLDQLATPDLPTPVIRGLTWDDRYLYAITENTGTEFVILRRSIHGAWHVFYRDGSAGTKRGEHVAVSAVFGYPALFFSYWDAGSTRTHKFIRLPTFPNPIQDTNYRYDSGVAVRIRMPRIGSAAAQMLIDRLDIQSRQLAAGITITPYYSADGGAITQFGSTVATSSPSQTITPATAITCNFFDLYFELNTNTAATSPVLTGFSLKGVWRPGMRRSHTFTVSAATYHSNNRAGGVKQSPVTTIANLQALRTQGTYATVTDENGQSFSGVVIEVKRAMVRLTPPNTEPEHAVQFTLLEKAS